MGGLSADMTIYVIIVLGLRVHTLLGRLCCDPLTETAHTGSAMADRHVHDSSRDTEHSGGIY